MIDQSTVQTTVAAIALAADADYKKRMFYPQDVPQDKAGATHGLAKGFEAKHMKFTVQQGTTPSEALYNFFHGGEPVVCECHAFVMAVYYYTVRELLGADLFNIKFAGMDISGQFSPTSPLRSVLTQASIGNSVNDIRKGDWIYISNIPDYKQRHLFGNAPGWNLICVSDGDPRKYVGFGLSESTEVTQGKSIDEIKTILLDEYKKPSKIEFTSTPNRPLVAGRVASAHRTIQKNR